MDGLTLQDWVSAIFARQWSAAGVEPPQLSLGELAVIVRGALREHDVDPLTPRVSELVNAEGFTLMWALIPRRCGAARGRTLYVTRGHPPEVLRVLIHHERAHGWIFKRRDNEATEADVWFLTAMFAWPPWLAHRSPPPLPEWFLEHCRAIHHKSYGMSLTG